MTTTSTPSNPVITAGTGRVTQLIATVCGIGYLRPGPGTWASAATLLLWWAAARQLRSSWQIATALGVALVLTAIGIPAATCAARRLGRDDPSVVVIDEAAGQMLALVAVPLQWKYLLVSFILFRGFDIWKPPPLRRLEQFPGGWGIVLDDLGAGCYALAILHGLLYLRVLG